MFETKWFRIVSTEQAAGDPYYFLQLPDYVSVIALTKERGLVLVRQYRPVIDRQSLELPAGHVDADETPEAAARRELLEETGFVAPQLELLGTLVPDVGRLANRMWCYFAADVRPTATPYEPEAGVSVVVLPEREALARAADGSIDHALNLAPLYLALAAGKLSFGSCDRP